MPSQWVEYLREILFPDRDRHGIPPLDGAFRANDALERCKVLARLPAPDDILATRDGTVWITSGNGLWRLVPGEAAPEEVADLGAPAGGLGLARDGRLIVCAGRRGVALCDAGGRVEFPGAEDGPEAPTCPTAAVELADGRLIVADGSRVHAPADWLRDLMALGRTGRLLCLEPGAKRWTVLDRGLAWPGGLCLSQDGQELLVTEAWTHRLLGYPADDPGPQGRRTVIANMPGYPARIRPAGEGGYWLALFAMRTALVELVLTETALREEMIATMEPDHWIAPALAATGDPHECTQLGRVRVLGYLKPWAPPRSYGLVVRLDGDGRPVTSLHSRADGARHGITGLCPSGDDLLIASKGHGLILMAEDV